MIIIRERLTDSDEPPRAKLRRRVTRQRNLHVIIDLSIAVLVRRGRPRAWEAAVKPNQTVPPSAATCTPSAKASSFEGLEPVEEGAPHTDSPVRTSSDHKSSTHPRPALPVRLRAPTSAAEPRAPTYLWLTESAEPLGGHHLRSLGVCATLRALSAVSVGRSTRACADLGGSG